MQTKQDKARAARALRRARAKAALGARIAEVQHKGFQEGHEAGVKSGASLVRAQVLEAAARHFKLGRDLEADAIREVHSTLLSYQKEVFQTGAEKKG